MDIIFVEMIGTATLAITLFGVVFCLTRPQYKPVYRSFALFLSVVALNNLHVAFTRVLDALQSPYMQTTMIVIGMFGSLCLGPFFWIYVVRLTSTAQKGPRKVYLHLLLPALALVIGLSLNFLPQDIVSGLAAEDDIDLSGWSAILILIVGLLQLSLYGQIGVYLYLTIRRLGCHRRRLKNFYSNTEQHELRWIYVIAALALFFWLAQLLALATVLHPSRVSIPESLLSVPGFAVFVAIVFWGLRQRPALIRDSVVNPSPEKVNENLNVKVGKKYEKSALTAAASERLERKLRAAMEVDHLHRAPNLSLWVLARHVGASPNNVSQVLNERIGKSFFDFINDHRISEATQRLVETDETVLTVTYDVGFNSRSSFYSAFKRMTGHTPTSYRKNMSGRDVSDDTTGQIVET